MRIGYLVPMLLAVAASCGDYRATGPYEPPPPPPPPAILLKDVVVSTLPSPYYHFEYDATGRVNRASFASDLRTYDLSYSGDRLTEVDNVRNQDRLEYIYDPDGKVGLVKYVNSTGVFTLVFFTYDGSKLVKVERDRRVTGGFIIDKTIDLAYDADGNLHQRREHFPPIDGIRDEVTTIDTYEDYDSGTNVDGFSLIHDEFFDHLVLLPGVLLQKNNPKRETRTGDGVNFVVDYFYTYDGLNRPRIKLGTGTITNGTQAGQTFPTLAQFSYY